MSLSVLGYSPDLQFRIVSDIDSEFSFDNHLTFKWSAEIDVGIGEIIDSLSVSSSIFYIHTIKIKSSSINHVKIILDSTNPILYNSLKPGAQNEEFKSSQV